MELEVDRVLAQRRGEMRRLYRWLSWLGAIGLHGAVIAGAFLAPLLTAEPAEPIEFVEVQVVPLQALGVARPAAPRPAVPSEPPREPEPEEDPEPDSRQPDAEPEPAPAETLPEPRRERSARPPQPQRRQPSVARESAAPTGRTQRRGSPSGSSLGTSALGASVGGLDNPDFVYGYYVDQMLSMISSQWTRPAIGGEVEALVHFRILKNGSITDLRVVRSSGYNSFDLAGLRAVQLAAPFPKLPQTYRHESLGVNLILR